MDIHLSIVQLLALFGFHVHSILSLAGDAGIRVA